MNIEIDLQKQLLQIEEEQRRLDQECLSVFIFRMYSFKKSFERQEQRSLRIGEEIFFQPYNPSLIEGGMGIVEKTIDWEGKEFLVETGSGKMILCTRFDNQGWVCMREEQQGRGFVRNGVIGMTIAYYDEKNRMFVRIC